MRWKFWRRKPLSFREWLRRKRRLSEWIERAIPPDVTDPSQIISMAGRNFPTDYRSYIGADLKAAVREWMGA